MKLKRWRLLELGMVIIITISLISACNKAEAIIANEKVLVYGSGDYSSINPALYEDGEINSLIFNGLTAHDGDNNIIPELAKDWEFDKSTNTYTFNLRDDVKWHDGENFLADDVKFTLDIIKDPNNLSEIASNYEDITKIEVVDKNTIKISLKSPNVAILDYLTVGILPKHILEGRDILTDEFNQFPIGTGPFKMETWDKGQSITLVKNEDFYGKEPQIDKVIFKIVKDIKVRALQLESGELDLAQITPNDMVMFEENKDFVIYNLKTADYRGIMYNFNSPLFKNNRELPNALSYAIDRQIILDTVALGLGSIAYSPLQFGDYNNPNMEKFDYNPNKSREILESSGWSLSKDGIYEKNGERLSFTINCMEGDQVRRDIAQICAQQFNEIGANVKVAIKSKIDWENQEAFLIAWGSPYDPDDHTYKVFGTEKSSNYSYYSNQRVDELLEKARETDVKSERKEYYNEFQEELTKDMPYTFIIYVDAQYIGKPNLNGINEGKVLGHHGSGVFWNIADWTID